MALAIAETTVDESSTFADLFCCSSQGCGSGDTDEASSKAVVVKPTKPSSLLLSKIGFGCWQFGSLGEQDYWGFKCEQDLANTLVHQVHKRCNL